MVGHSRATFPGQGDQASRCGTCAHSEFCDALSRSQAADQFGGGRSRQFFGAAPGKQIVAHGRATSDVYVLCVGWAFRYLQLRDGRRQIIKFLLPGDLLSPELVLDAVPQTSVKALTAVQVAAFSRTDIQAEGGDRDLGWTVTRSLIDDGRDLNRLLAVVAQMDAETRIAHLLLHLMRRIATKSVIREECYLLPIRQQHIADTVGLTTVHVSRVLGGFRERGILTLARGELQVFDREGLERLAF